MSSHRRGGHARARCRDRQGRGKWDRGGGRGQPGARVRRTSVALTVARMGVPPGLHPGDRGGTAVVVAILLLGQPLGLTGALTGGPARSLRAVALVTGIARIRGEVFAAMRTRPPLFPPHVVSLARSPIQL